MEVEDEEVKVREEAMESRRAGIDEEDDEDDENTVENKTAKQIMNKS